jgi:hypothetical protein
MGNSADLIADAADSSRYHIHLDRAIFGTT